MRLIGRGVGGVLYLLAWMVAPAPAAELVETFDSGVLDTRVWDPCQAGVRVEPRLDWNGRLVRYVLANTVDETTGNVDQCGAALSLVGDASLESENPADEPIGPSALQPVLPPDAQSAKSCPTGNGLIYQRSELRIRSQRSDLLHDAADPHWYSMTFRVEGQVPHCGSARWILAQWKDRDSPSPFLAQRFDNGVLHITVQNGHCRCVVAQAGGDFDAMTLAALGIGSVAPSDLRATRPIKCIRTDRIGEVLEQSCEPQGLTVLTQGGRLPPTLPDPKRKWVTLSYLVRDGADGKGRIDVYAGSTFIVRVLGAIGYPSEHPGKVKFKFGHYRDRIPGRATLSVDRVCFSKSVERCAPDVRALP